MTSYQKNFGPFAIAQQHANNFCHNLFLSNAVNQCVLQLAKIEEEYNQAVLNFDDELAERKMLELQTYQSSLTLTAHMFYESDEISA
tara:strand:+ start:982 stop:1242 length:261 start_codon:yes stop_codon:yes gene_type:complete